MTNATKTLSFLFAGTLVLALATSWGWSSSSSAAFQEELLAVDTSQVEAVRIDQGSGSSIRLHRTEDGWTVSPSDTSAEYPASAQAVDRLFSTLPSLSVNTVATRQPDKHARYGVDSTGTRVTLLDADDAPLGEMYIGQTQMQRPQPSGPRSQMQRRRQGTLLTYVRPADQPDVYSVEAPLRSVVDRNLTDWRDKQIWALDRSQIQRVDFEHPADSSFTIERVTSSDTASAAAPDAWISAGDTLNSRSVSSLLRTLSSPDASGFAENLSPDTFGEALHTIHLQLKNGSRRTLRLRPNQAGDTYLTVADGFPYVAELPQDRWDRSVLQGRTALRTDNGSSSPRQSASSLQNRLQQQ